MSIFNKKPLSRDDILGAKDIVIEEVEVPGWGGSVYVKGMTGFERDRFESAILQQRGKSQGVNMINIRAKLVAASVCEEDGKLLFSQKDITELGKKSAASLQIVFDLASRLSGITEEDVEELSEELEENPSDGSVSD